MHLCRYVGPASTLRGFNGVLHSVFIFHDTKRPRATIDDRPVPQLLVPLASLLRSQDGPRFARVLSSRRLPYFMVGILRCRLLMFPWCSSPWCIYGCFLWSPLRFCGDGFDPEPFAPWCGLRGCLGWCVAIGCLALR